MHREILLFPSIEYAGMVQCLQTCSL